MQRGIRNLGKLPVHFSPTVPPSAAGCSRVVTRVETSGGESWKETRNTRNQFW